MQARAHTLQNWHARDKGLPSRARLGPSFPQEATEQEHPQIDTDVLKVRARLRPRYIREPGSEQAASDSHSFCSDQPDGSTDTDHSDSDYSCDSHSTAQVSDECEEGPRQRRGLRLAQVLEELMSRRSQPRIAPARSEPGAGSDEPRPAVRAR